MTSDEFEQLCTDYFDGGLAPGGRATLEAELKASPEARRAFWQAAEWQALFIEWGEQQSGREAALPPPKPAAAPPRSRSRPRLLRGTRAAKSAAAPARHRHTPRPSFPKLALAAMLAVAAGIAALWWHETGVLAAIATVEESSQARWAGLDRAPGSKVPAGPLELSSGVAQLRLRGGARLILQAPARIRLLSPAKCALEFGRIFVEATDGFLVEAPGLDVRDLGTRFGVSTGAGSSEVHVFEGKVEAAAASARRRIPANQAAAVRAGALVAIPLDREAFPQAAGDVAVPVANPSFEEPALLKPESFPRAPGYWAGDPAVLTPARAGVAPHDGTRMLQFTTSVGLSADLWQIVDLHTVRALISTGAITATAFAEVNCATPPASTAPQHAIVSLLPYHGSAADAAEVWRARALQTSGDLKVDENPATWQTASHSVPIPADSDFVIVSIHCSPNPTATRTVPERFFDSVRVTLHLPPVAGKRK